MAIADTNINAPRDSLGEPIDFFYHNAYSPIEHISDAIATLFLDAACELSDLKRNKPGKIERILQTSQLLLDASARLHEKIESIDNIRDGINMDLGEGCAFAYQMTFIWPAPEGERDLKKLSKDYSKKLRNYGLEMSDPKRIPQDRLDELKTFCLRVSEIETARWPLPGVVY